ncbi:hypothetical protein PvNV_031 [Penaeus vannamei nudivirus]|nr:hypothetical protein PvSNPV_031 [Penaeus vannamei nucleopolyhedrovirus]
MFVYKSKFNANHRPERLEKTALNDKHSSQFIIYIIPKNVSIYSAIVDPSTFGSLSLNITSCNIFIYTDVELDGDVLTNIEEYIEKNVSGYVTLYDPMKIKIIGMSESPHAAISSLGNINLFYSSHKNKSFEYINYRNKEYDTIDAYDSIISYRQLADRNIFTSLCGKVFKDGGGVALFQCAPLKRADKVFILPPEFYVLTESNNKIALLRTENFTFWLVTIKNTFINETKQPIPIATSSFCLKSLSNITINEAFEVFRKYSFGIMQTTDNCLYSEDAMNDMMLFTGIYDLPNSFKYAKCFDMLVRL